MQDIEKNRAEYVNRLETLLEHAQQELAKFKAIAQKWEPQCQAEISTSTQSVNVTLNFGGKRSTASMKQADLSRVDLVTATSAIVDALIESNVAARLREAVEPEIQRILPNLIAIGNAGKW